tara:strand:+ start:17984 stop:18667 length:684 start_codon:yes stop_codon:yes gene_type:complete
VQVALFDATASEQKTVVELFTSQACPACRPAEALIEELSDRDDVLPLAFHVNYWDFTGWKDPFANETFSVRQRTYNTRFGVPFVATPQFVINGRLQLAGSGGGLLEEILSAKAAEDTTRPELAVQLVEHNAARIVIGPVEVSAKYVVLIVRYTPSLKTYVSEGDNAGLELKNTNVVRDLHAVGLYEGRALVLTVPIEGFEDSSDRVAVLLQKVDLGTIIGAKVLNRP